MIAGYCALMAKNIAQGIEMALNITDESDSTGSMLGQFLGVLHSYETIPNYLLNGLELRYLIDQTC